MADDVDIQIPNIEAELKRLQELPKDKKQQKACLFTLIIFAHDPRRVNYLQELVDGILDKFPCRIIFIKGDNTSKKEYFHVSVSNVMSGQGNTRVVCDQITIEASKNQFFRIPFLITPLIVTDLPVNLLWGQNPFEELEIFPSIHPYASRVIFDSECSDNLNHFCEEMLTSLKVLKMDVMDINWALVSNWRDMLVMLFDCPQKFEELKALKSIIISYNDSKTETLIHPEVRAIYLQGWLASRLKWKYRQTEKLNQDYLISYYSETNPVVIALSPQNHPELPSGAIMSIQITTTTGHKYTITRKGDLPLVLVHASTKEQCALPFTLPLPNIHRGLTFMREIFYQQLSDHYREMLKCISQIDFKVF